MTTDGGSVLRGLVDSGSMAYTVSVTADPKLSQSVPDIEKISAEDFVIVGCGSQLVTPSAKFTILKIKNIKTLRPGSFSNSTNHAQSNKQYTSWKYSKIVF